MFQPLNTTPLNSGDIAFNAVNAYMPSMVSSGEIDDILVGWGESLHSMSCSGILFQNLEATCESSHRSMVCTCEADISQFGVCSAAMEMVSNGEAFVGQYASAESFHSSMVCESIAEIIPQLYAESTMAMNCSCEVLHVIDTSYVLCFHAYNGIK